MVEKNVSRKDIEACFKKGLTILFFLMTMILGIVYLFSKNVCFIKIIAYASVAYYLYNFCLFVKYKATKKFLITTILLFLMAFGNILLCYNIDVGKYFILPIFLPIILVMAMSVGVETTFYKSFIYDIEISNYYKIFIICLCVYFGIALYDFVTFCINIKKTKNEKNN